jgi:hypothetical protein
MMTMMLLWLQFSRRNAQSCRYLFRGGPAKDGTFGRLVPCGSRSTFGRRSRSSRWLQTVDGAPTSLTQLMAAEIMADRLHVLISTRLILEVNCVNILVVQSPFPRSKPPDDLVEEIEYEVSNTVCAWGTVSTAGSNDARPFSGARALAPAH